MSPPDDVADRRADSISTGELARRLDRLDHSFHAGLDEIKRSLTDAAQTFVRADLYISERQASREDFKSVAAIAKWALGLVCGLVLTTLMSFLLWLATRA